MSSLGIVLIVLVRISFSHGYSAILATKLMIKLDLSSQNNADIRLVFRI